MDIKLHPEEVRFIDLFLLTHFGTSLKKLQKTEDIKKNELVVARRIVYKFLRMQKRHKTYKYTLSEVGSVFNRGHGAVLHSIRAFDNIIDTKYPKELYIIYSQLLNANISDGVRLEGVKDTLCWLSTDLQYELYKWLGNKLKLK